MAEEKKRHGCLTAWLVLMIIGNSATAFTYLFGGVGFSQAFPGVPGWAMPLLVLMSIFNLVCSVALLRWKKWGFWGFAATTVFALILNLSFGLSVGSALSGLLGIFILYGVLHIGKENKGWSQLD